MNYTETVEALVAAKGQKVKLDKEIKKFFSLILMMSTLYRFLRVSTNSKLTCESIKIGRP